MIFPASSDCPLRTSNAPPRPGAHVVHVALPRPDAIVVVQLRRVRRLREAEHREKGRIAARDRMLELAAAGHDASADAAPHQVFAREAIHRANLVAKLRRRRRHRRIHDEIRYLVVRRRRLQVGRAARRCDHRVAAVDANVERRDQALVRRIERAHEGEPEQRRVHVVVDALAQQVVGLPAASGVAVDAKAWTAWILRLRAVLQPIEEHARRANGIGKRAPQCGELIAIQQIDVRVCGAEQRRVDREEEAQPLDLEIVDIAIVRLLGMRAEDELSILDDVPGLFGEDGLEPECAELIGDLDAVVAARKGRGDESRRRRGEVDIAHVDTLEPGVADRPGSRTPACSMTRIRAACRSRRRRASRSAITPDVLIDPRTCRFGQMNGARQPEIVPSCEASSELHRRLRSRCALASIRRLTWAGSVPRRRVLFVLG